MIVELQVYMKYSVFFVDYCMLLIISGACNVLKVAFL